MTMKCQIILQPICAFNLSLMKINNASIISDSPPKCLKAMLDKRQIFVRLTDAGNAVVEEHRAPIRARDQAMRSAFKPEEYEQLVEYFDRLDAITNVPAAEFFHVPDSSDQGDDT